MKLKPVTRRRILAALARAERAIATAVVLSQEVFLEYAGDPYLMALLDLLTAALRRYTPEEDEVR